MLLLGYGFVCLFLVLGFVVGGLVCGLFVVVLWCVCCGFDGDCVWWVVCLGWFGVCIL